VLLKEVIEGLAINPNGIYIDATFGRGGHSTEILRHLGQRGKLIAIDKDPDAVDYAKVFHEDKRFVIYHRSFTAIKEIVKQQDSMKKVNGILLDLGVSSPQLNQASRGFSFLKEGPLDMRMNPTLGISASDWINSASVTELEKVFKEYGEERFAKRIATAIVRERVKKPILTTTQLAEIVSEAHPRWEKRIHPATRVFQAVRIYINEELQELTQVLEQCLEVLATGGRLCVISFHSLEDRIVKQFLQKNIKGEDKPFPFILPRFKPRFKKITNPLRASAKEIAQNPRARSAILRIAEKIS
jgi:16S rRNA (cytosine1402-N4)-methyltransferase